MKKNNYRIIGVDFDGTLSFGKWPECGPANVGLLDFLKKRKADGDKLILWTCREGEELETQFSGVVFRGLPLMRLMIIYRRLLNNTDVIVEK